MLWCGRYNPGNRKRILTSKSDLVSAQTWHLVKRLVREYVHPQRWRMLAALLFMAVLSGCTTALAWLMKPVVEKLTEDDMIAIIAYVSSKKP